MTLKVEQIQQPRVTDLTHVGFMGRMCVMWLSGRLEMQAQMGREVQDQDVYEPEHACCYTVTLTMVGLIVSMVK